MRKLLGTIAGIVAAMLVIMGVQATGHAIDPPPASLDLTNPRALADYVASVPAWVKAIVLVGYFLGALVGGWIAVRLALWPVAAWIVAVLIAVAGIANLVQIPHPLWMQVGTIVAPLLGGWVAVRLGRPRVA